MITEERDGVQTIFYNHYHPPEVPAQVPLGETSAPDEPQPEPEPPEGRSE